VAGRHQDGRLSGQGAASTILGGTLHQARKFLRSFLVALV